VLWRTPESATAHKANAEVEYIQDIEVLTLVSSAREIKESVAAFNREAGGDPEFTKNILRQTTYWVFDPVTKLFGPSKFVGFKGMSVASYRRAQPDHWTGDRFDGNVTRLRMAQVLGYDYAGNEGLAERLETWAVQTASAPDIFKGVNRNKWRFITLPALESTTLPEEITTPNKYPEGATRKVFVNAYERSDEARDACIKYYGCTCVVCGFDFARRYGALGEGFIVVHHLTKLADIGKEYTVDPIRDLRPVCPNCHAMIHKEDPPIPIAELKKRLQPKREA